MEQETKRGEEVSAFAYSFVSIMLGQYDWSCHSYAANRQNMRNKKTTGNNLLAAASSLASPKSAGLSAAPIILAAEVYYMLRQFSWR